MRSGKRLKDMIKGILRGLFPHVPVSLVVCLALMSALPGCVSRTEVQREIDANVFLFDKLPKKICDQYPELADIGVYRKLNNGNEETVSYCDPDIELYLGFYNKDVQKMLDKYVPKKK